MLTYPLMGAIQEISARIGRTAGRGIALPLLATPKNPQSLSAAACFLRVAMEPRRCRHVVQVNGSAKAWVLQAWQSRKHAMEKPMGSSTDKVKGYANEAAGKVKQGVGKAVGNDRLRAKGAAQEIKGDAQKALGKAKDAIKSAADKVSAKAHEKL